MKKIVDVKTGEEINLTMEDLPMMVHGREHSGASLLSVTLAAFFHNKGHKLCIFTAYPMAKEEFLKQVEDRNKIFYLESENNFAKSSDFQTIIVQSGNMDLFIKLISGGNMADRILFVKNVETINAPIIQYLGRLCILSGDFMANPAQKGLMSLPYHTKIFLSPIDEDLPPLEKYQAFVRGRLGNKIVKMA